MLLPILSLGEFLSNNGAELSPSQLRSDRVTVLAERQCEVETDHDTTRYSDDTAILAY